jgi:hypothetical protein
MTTSVIGATGHVENDYTTDTFEKITGRPARAITEFLHEHRTDFL